MENTERLHLLFDAMLNQQVIAFTPVGVQELYSLSDDFDEAHKYIIDSINNDEELRLWSEEGQEIIYEVKPEWVII